MYVMGIDPGFTGAIALIDQDTGAVVLEDIPLTNYLGRKEIDPYEASNFIEQYAPLTILAGIEAVGAMPKQGLSSTFRFGFGAGLLTGLLAGHHVAIVRVVPAVWKSALNLGTNKADSIAKAIQLYPQIASQLTRKKDDGRAEALLIAHFAKIMALKNDGKITN